MKIDRCYDLKHELHKVVVAAQVKLYWPISIAVDIKVSTLKAINL